MSGKVCVFGSFNFDMVARVDRFPVPGESLVACGSMTSAGGKGANQATAALKAGANVHYIGKIGNDTFGHFARRHLKGVGFNAVTLLVAEEIPTGNALIYVAAIGCADVVLVQLENNLSAIEQVIDAGKQAGALVILNPAPWQPVEHAVLSKVDLLTPNATEAGLMTGRWVDSLTAAAEAADVLHAQGARNVIITLGASGALLSEHGVKSPIPCFPSHPRDTTGAGDAFNGALAARLACGNRYRPQPDSRRPMPPSVSKSKAPHLYLSTWRHRNGFSVPPLIMKWHKPYCIKNIKRIAQ
ncbi:putative ribokinase [Klebsiella pneumoniae]|uniref:Ribokinase n=1 Tax=Klebsiella pneumoniae TaxID=573 RepID=A0A377X9U7_KLEPN|nr:putative ribokinase [Klebsiella pneumoniae]